MLEKSLELKRDRDLVEKPPDGFLICVGSLTIFGLCDVATLDSGSLVCVNSYPVLFSILVLSG